MTARRESPATSPARAIRHAADRERYWRTEDVQRRMDFALRCAEAHGVSAIRTHLDSYEGQGDITWAVFRRDARGLARPHRSARRRADGRSISSAAAYGDYLADIVAASAASSAA